MRDRSCISLKEVTFGYRGKHPIFHRLTTLFAADNSESGKCIAVMGPSGCGKTTLLKLLMGALQPSNGTLVRTPLESYCSFISQDPLLFEQYSRERNARYFTTLANVRDRFEESRFTSMVELLDLGRSLEDNGPISEMSGGERQRLSLLRAMSVRPDFLMLDEPCTGLDRPVKHSFLIALRELFQHQGNVIFYATHHLEETLLIADQIAFLQPGPNGTTITLHYDDVQSLLDHPPSLSVAAFLTEKSFNTMQVVLLDNRWTTLTGGYLIGRLSALTASINPQSPVIIAVQPESVSWTDDENGIPVQIVGASGHRSVVSSDCFRGRWIAPLPSTTDSHYIRIEGTVKLFGLDNSYLGTAVLG